MSVFRRFAFVAPILSLAVFAVLAVALILTLRDSDRRELGQTSVATSSVSTGSAAAAAPQAAANTLEPGNVAGPTAASGPLRVHPTNPRYFADANGKVIYLAGSHTWLNLVDGTLTDPPAAFGYTAWLDFLQANKHNFFRLWTWEQTWWVVEWGQPYYFTPHPYQRTGPGNALDGKPKFDLTKFNQAYFDRLRQRVIEAGNRGIYVSVMLFNGWSVDYPKGFYNAGNPWSGHPFNAANNINGINGDPNNDNGGQETHTLAVPAVTAIQEAYIKKVIDTVNDLDNVLYEISNESDSGSTAWQYQMINVIKAYEATKPKQHPVGMTVDWPNGNNTVLFDSPADWISPNGDINNPPAASGAKVILADTDHLCGICGDRKWVWKSFTRGENPQFMDQYDDLYKLDGGGYNLNNPNDVSLRLNLGYTRDYANRINLAAMTPRPELASTGYCLANAAAQNAEYLVYLPDGGMVNVDLSATPGTVNVEWFNPANGQTIQGAAIEGGASRSFSPPFSGDAVLYIYQTQAPPTYTLTVSTVGSGSVAVNPAGPYTAGQQVTLTASATGGWQFSGWSGGAAGATNPLTLTINGNTAVTATFVEVPPVQYTLTVNTAGNGTVDVSPAQATYSAGQIVTLTAFPAAGWQFAGWSGAAGGAENPKQVTITGNTVVTATFTPIPEPTFKLFVPVQGSGSVQVTPTGPYTSGQKITLTALPAAGWQFANWSGGIQGSANPTTFTIAADTVVTATFVEKPVGEHTLTTKTIGRGTAVVFPAQATYKTGQVVLLTAIPARGWIFIRWSGEAKGISNPRYLRITADTVVTATFVKLPRGSYPLMVQTVGDGSVYADPLGPYNSGQVVTVTAEPDPGWVFDAWSGDTMTTTNPVVLTITADTVLTSTFVTDTMPFHVYFATLMQKPVAVDSANGPAAASPSD